MGTIVRATCSCGYGSGDLGIGIGMMQMASTLAVCRHCREVVAARDDTRLRCPQCRRKPERLGIGDVEAPVAGLECPRCSQPTLTLEPVGLWD